MADRPLCHGILCDGDGNKLSGIAPLALKSGRLVMTAWDDFPASEAVFGGDERASVAILSQDLGATIKFYQLGVGLISWNLIEDPSLDINDSGDTISVVLANITDQMTRNSVGIGATYETALGSIISQIGSMGESVPWTTYYGVVAPSTTPQVIGYSALYSDGTRHYDTAGNVTFFDPTIKGAKASAWTATMLDDGPNVLGASAVRWESAAASITVDVNNLNKLTGAAYNANDGAVSSQVLGQVYDASGAAAHSDGGFSWTAADVGHEILAGLGSLTGLTAADIRYAWWMLPSATPGATGATSIAYPLQLGVQFTVGGVIASTQYAPGDTLSIAIDYSTGTARTLYQVNGDTIAIAPVAPDLLAHPLRPMAFLATPGAQLRDAMVMLTTKPSQQNYLIRFEQETPLESVVRTAKVTGVHVRQQQDATGAPIRGLEVGLFGTQSGIRLTGGTGGDLEKMVANPKLRLITKLTWKQETSKVINTITPLGASTGATQVTLERPWKMVNDQTYPNYGRYGASVGSLFPEYLINDYPIFETLGRNGTWEYWVRDAAAYARHGFEIRAKYSDPQFQFGTDSTVANQELIARALYIATVAKLKWESTANDTLDIEAVGTFRPPIAGSRVLMDFRRIGGDVQGNFAAMSTQARANLKNPYVTLVERNFIESGEVSDHYALSFLPRRPLDDSTSGASSLRDLEAIKIVPQNTTTYLTVYETADVDSNPNAEHALIAEIRVPSEVFRITSAPLDVRLSPLRQQVKTTKNSDATIIITIPTATVTITSIHDDTLGTSHKVTTIAGGVYNPAKGFITSKDEIGGMPLHFHQLPIYAVGQAGTPSSQVAPDQFTRYMAAFSAGSVFRPYINNSGPGIMETNAQMNRVSAPAPIDLSVTAATHAVPVSQYVGVARTLTGTIDQQNFTAPLPEHTHDMDTNLNDVASPTLVELDLDPGTGQFTQILDVADQISGLIAQWSASFYLPDISKYLGQCAGKLVRIRVRSLTNAQNGIGHLRIQGQWRAEIGGITSQVFTAN